MPQSLLARRLVAFLVDVACAGLPLLITIPVAGAFWQSAGDGELAAEVMLTANAFLSVGLFYAVAFTQLVRGRPTLGQRAMGLSVSSCQGGPAPWPAALARVLISAALLAAAVALRAYPVLLLPALWSLFDVEGRTPIDMATRTRVLSILVADEGPASPSQDTGGPGAEPQVA
jgi:uncharacterized RDD family membrane protein YckC